MSNCLPLAVFPNASTSEVLTPCVSIFAAPLCAHRDFPVRLGVFGAGGAGAGNPLAGSTASPDGLTAMGLRDGADSDWLNWVGCTLIRAASGLKAGGGEGLGLNPAVEDGNCAGMRPEIWPWAGAGGNAL